MSDDQIEQSMLYFVNKDIQLIKKTCSFQLHNNCRIRSNHYSEVILGSTYGYLKGKVTSKLGFELNTNFEDPEELKTLSEDLVSTHKNIIKGAVLLGQISSVGVKLHRKVTHHLH